MVRDDQIIHYGMPQNIWWPLYDQKFEACHKYVMDRIRDMDLALKYVKSRRVCLQAGGHAGLWPRRLARLFQEVRTFEPEPILYRCLKLNVNGAPNVIADPFALSNQEGEVRMVIPSVTSGQSRIEEGGPIVARAITIDSLSLPCLDALYLDVEGHEVAVMQGGQNTIRRHRPVIHVELLPRARDGIRAYLKSIGYREVARVHGDAVFIRS